MAPLEETRADPYSSTIGKNASVMAVQLQMEMRCRQHYCHNFLPALECLTDILTHASFTRRPRIGDLRVTLIVAGSFLSMKRPRGVHAIIPELREGW